MSKVFVDTSAWIAILDNKDVNHSEAVTILKVLLRSNDQLYISNHIISETYTWLRKKTGIEASLKFVQAIKEQAANNKLIVIYSDYTIEEEAYYILLKYKDQDFSYADAVSFAIMKSKKIKKSFTYDKHFLTAGFLKINLTLQRNL